MTVCACVLWFGRCSIFDFPTLAARNIPTFSSFAILMLYRCFVCSSSVSTFTAFPAPYSYAWHKMRLIKTYEVPTLTKEKKSGKIKHWKSRGAAEREREARRLCIKSHIVHLTGREREVEKLIEFSWSCQKESAQFAQPAKEMKNVELRGKAQNEALRNPKVPNWKTNCKTLESPLETQSCFIVFLAILRVCRKLQR